MDGHVMIGRHHMGSEALPPLESLLAHRARFLSFVRARVPERQAAEDLLQSAFASAVEHASTIPEGHQVPWFYRVLRNAITDRHRRLAAEGRAREAWENDPTRAPRDEPPRRLCRCTAAALASLNPRYAQIIRAVDLDERPVVEFAASEGLTSANAYVRLHRARRLLAERLRAICRKCAETACLDCHCKGSDEAA